MFQYKIGTGCRFHLQQFLAAAPVKRFIRRTLTLGCFFSLNVYGWVRLIFHDVPFELWQETGMILQLLLVGCGLTGLCIGSFNLLMFVTDYYAAPVRKQKITMALWSVFKPAARAMAPTEYDLFNSQTIFTIDKTGRLRYVVRIVGSNNQPKHSFSENECGHQNMEKGTVAAVSE